MDMSGNVWEWQANFYDESSRYPSLRGGSWNFNEVSARVAVRNYFHPFNGIDYLGFRAALLPSG